MPMNSHHELDLNDKEEAQEAEDGEAGTTKKRTKERKIGEILDKVLQWRRFYTGFTDPTTGQTIKMSLEDSAVRVGIAKKSLDDYLLQIRFGKKHGFNFNDHCNDKVGILRSFVKKFKNKNAKKEHGNIGAENNYDEDFDYKNEKASRRKK